MEGGRPGLQSTRSSGSSSRHGGAGNGVGREMPWKPAGVMLSPARPPEKKKGTMGAGRQSCLPKLSYFAALPHL